MCKPQIAWNVYLDREYEGMRLIDTVFYTPDCDEKYVKSTLIEHDGYPRAIIVRRVS